MLEHHSRVLADKVRVAVEDRLNDIIQLRLDILSMHQISLPGVELGWHHFLEILGWVGEYDLHCHQEDYSLLRDERVQEHRKQLLDPCTKEVGEIDDGMRMRLELDLLPEPLECLLAGDFSEVDRLVRCCRLSFR